jgi:hypothetical protein
MARGAIKLAAIAALAKKARDYARQNPESVSSTIEKVESAVSRKVPPKYAHHVGRGGAVVRSGLGISSTTQHPGVTPPASTPPPTPPSA